MEHKSYILKCCALLGLQTEKKVNSESKRNLGLLVEKNPVEEALGYLAE